MKKWMKWKSRNIIKMARAGGGCATCVVLPCQSRGQIARWPWTLNRSPAPRVRVSYSAPRPRHTTTAHNGPARPGPAGASPAPPVVWLGVLRPGPHCPLRPPRYPCALIDIRAAPPTRPDPTRSPPQPSVSGSAPQGLGLAASPCVSGRGRSGRSKGQRRGRGYHVR